MKMGIERVLKERFGGELKEVMQADDNGDIFSSSVTIDAVDAHLDSLRPAIMNYGGEVTVVDISEDSIKIAYNGPEPILHGIKAAIKDKFPTILEINVIST